MWSWVGQGRGEGRQGTWGGTSLGDTDRVVGGSGVAGGGPDRAVAWRSASLESSSEEQHSGLLPRLSAVPGLGLRFMYGLQDYSEDAQAGVVQ